MAAVLTFACQDATVNLDPVSGPELHRTAQTDSDRRTREVYEHCRRVARRGAATFEECLARYGVAPGDTVPRDTVPEEPRDTLPEEPADTIPEEPADTLPEEPTDTLPDEPAPEGCDVLVTPGDDVQALVNVANRRSCLEGIFTLADAIQGDGARDGVDMILFDLTATGAIVDGSRATIQGDFNAQDNLGVQVSGVDQVLVDLRIRTGFIVVSSSAVNPTITRPNIGFAVAPNGNFGLIRTLGGNGAGPTGVEVYDAVLTDVYGCEPQDATLPCNGETLTWDVAFDREHLACFTIQGESDVLLSGGFLARCPSLFYFKQFTRTSPVVIENVTGQEAATVGQCRSGNKEFRNVDFGDIPQVGATDRQCVTTP